MTKIKIMTDSSAQLTPEEIKQNNITVIPLLVTIDDETYLDGVDISRREFVIKMNEAQTLPKTSQPPIGEIVDTIKALTADGSEVIGIFLGKELSGTHDAVIQAAEMIGKAGQVHVIDSELTDRTQGLQVIAAAKAANNGKSLAEISAAVERIKKTQQLHLLIINFENIVKGGRLGAVSGKLAALLNIKLELQMPGGHLIVAKKGRGKKFARAFDQRVLADIEAHKNQIRDVGISYVATEKEIPQHLQELVKCIKEINSKINVLVRETSPVISTHAGMGAYALLYNYETE